MSHVFPLLIPRNEAVSLKEAARRTKLSVDTIRRLNARHAIARQIGPGSPIEVSFPALLMLQHGDTEALNLLKNDRRDDPRVRRYLNLIAAV